MKKFFRIVFYLTTFLFCSGLYSQDTLSTFSSLGDSLKSSFSTDTFLVRRFDKFEFNNRIEYQPIDTLLNLFHRFNPSERLIAPTVGNIGLAHQSMIFSPDESIGFRFWRNHFTFWELFSENISFYQTRVPFTDLTFAPFGPRNEHYFNGLHTQNINPYWNFGVRFNRIRTDGILRNHNAEATNIGFHTSYLSRDKKYGVLANAFYNNLSYRENGGLEEENEAFIDKELLSVALNNAAGRRNSRGFKIRQHFNYSYLKDSIANNDTITERQYIVRSGFFHEVSYNDYRYSYFDLNPRDTFYLRFFSPSDTLEFRDSIRYLMVNNSIGWNIYSEKLNYSIWIMHQYADIGFINLNSGRNLNNIFLGSELEGKIVGFTYNINSSYIINGAHQGDFDMRGNINFRKRRYNYGFTSRAWAQSPEFIMEEYHSSLFNWRNSFKKNKGISAGAFLKSPSRSMNFTLNINLLRDYLYFNNQARPEQFIGDIFIAQLKGEKSFSFKRFRLLSELIGQFNTGNEYIRIPGLVSRNAFFLEFGKTEMMKLQVGLDVLYLSGFLGYAYMPLTSQFFLQNEERHGNYPWVDFFVNLKVQRVRAFAKITHLNQDFMGTNYNLFYRYPSNIRAFRVGISWIFFN
jgi:hypothetical protein